MGVTYLVSSACTACGACLLTCPAHAIRPDPVALTVLRSCTDCGECIEICPVDAIARLEPVGAPA
jgi:ferredoxin